MLLANEDGQLAVLDLLIVDGRTHERRHPIGTGGCRFWLLQSESLDRCGPVAFDIQRHALHFSNGFLVSPAESVRRLLK